MSAPATSTAPVYGAVPGQPAAVAQLRAAATAPVHAYLLVGPAGSGKLAAARAFAAQLLCPERGCGTCRSCRLALAGRHADLEIVERAGAFITMDQAREIVARASLSPAEGRRKVVVVTDLHLVRDAAPALLKIVEEPPATTVFVLLAEAVPPELVPIASRCVQIELGPVPEAAIVEHLVAAGIHPEVAEDVAAASGGRIDRADLLARDPSFAERRQRWRALPERLDGSGSQVGRAVDAIVATLDDIADRLLADVHAEEVAAVERDIQEYGARRSLRKDTEDRHRRERRRARTDELWFLLATLAERYRDELVAAPARREVLDAVAEVQATADAMERNPNEVLLLQRLLLRLPPLRATGRG